MPKGIHKQKQINEMIECACGCGERLWKLDGRGRERLFIHNHHSRLQENKRSELRCDNCGITITKPQWWIKRVKHHFCSQSCEGKHATKTGRRAGKNNGHYNSITVPCMCCGCDVTRAVSLISRSADVYCWDCCYDLYEPGITRPYTHYPPEFSEKLREEVRKRDEYKCQLCGVPQGKKRLAVHHIDYNKTNNHPLNLVALCEKCHGRTNFGTQRWIRVFSASPYPRR